MIYILVLIVIIQFVFIFGLYMEGKKFKDKYVQQRSDYLALKESYDKAANSWRMTGWKEK